MGGKSKNQRQNKSGAASQKPAKKHIAFHASKKSAAYQFVEPGYGEEFSLDANQKEFKTGHDAAYQETAKDHIVCLTSTDSEVYKCMETSCGEEFTSLEKVNDHEFHAFHRPRDCGEWVCSTCPGNYGDLNRFIRRTEANEHLERSHPGAPLVQPSFPPRSLPFPSGK